MPKTLVKDLMKKDPILIPSDRTLKEAAQQMEAIDCGALPVGTRDRLEGVITDRDIVLRAVAKGKDINKEKVKDYMTPGVCTVRENDTPDQAAGLMYEKNINRVMVEDENGNPCGILTFGHIIRNNEDMDEITSVIECAVGRRRAA